MGRATGTTRRSCAARTGGYVLDAHWADDYHHVVHALLTGEQSGYYMDYNGVRQLSKALGDGFVYTGQYSPFRQSSHGDDTAGIPAERFVVFSQNHDQVGNRMLGERLSKLVSFDGLKLAAGVVRLSPFVPLLFMARSTARRPVPLLHQPYGPGAGRSRAERRKSEFARFSGPPSRRTRNPRRRSPAAAGPRTPAGRAAQSASGIL